MQRLMLIAIVFIAVTVIHTGSYDKKVNVKNVEVTGRFHAFLEYVSDAMTPTCAHAKSSTIDIPDIGEVEFEHYVNKNEGISIFYFYDSEATKDSLSDAGDYTMREIMKYFGKGPKYYRVDLSYFSDGALKFVIGYMKKNKFPAYLIVNKKGNHANTYKIKGAAAKGSQDAVELKQTLTEAYKWMHKND